MGYVAVDLGTTNIKAASYDDALNRQAMLQAPVSYMREGKMVEFDAEAYFDALVEMLKKLNMHDCRCITLTGQAESFVLLGRDMRPLTNAISWMDERSADVCEELSQKFPEKEYYSVTGQCAVIPTWPATKILHLTRSQPELTANTAKYVMLKDYIAYRLTGKLAADRSIATFSSYFNIHTGQYWDDMLQACGIRADQLPPLIEPCTLLGVLLPETANYTGLGNAIVNNGTLDHFAGMIGTGNIGPGMVSESTGTVLAIATMAQTPLSGEETSALHYGPFKGTYVFLPTAESGGLSLEWFKNNFMPDKSFEDINRALSTRKVPNDLLFLPYLTGTNAPEFDADACGVFFGLRAEHDAIDLACAVMEGVAHLLAKNIKSVCGSKGSLKRIVSMGGGAKSDIWAQLKADITGLCVEIPEDSEAACLGAAMIGAVSSGGYADYNEAVRKAVHIKKRFLPRDNPEVPLKKAGFDALYRAMLETAKTMKKK